MRVYAHRCSFSDRIRILQEYRTIYDSALHVSGRRDNANAGGLFLYSKCPSLTMTHSPVENVLVQTVAGAVGTMPLGVGCVGVLPALKYVLKPSENGPIDLSLGQLVVWSLGICFFGVFVAVPLRKEMIIKEKLRFPSGTATALMIGVLHGGRQPIIKSTEDIAKIDRVSEDVARGNNGQVPYMTDVSSTETDHRDDWKKKIKLLIYAFIASAVYVSFASGFVDFSS